MLTWSNLAHAIGGMFDDDEYGPVIVVLPDGTQATISMGLLPDGKPCLHVVTESTIQTYAPGWDKSCPS